MSTTTFLNLTDPNVTGPARAVALASAVQTTLKAASRCEPGAHENALEKIAEARGYLSELEAEITAWEAAA